MKIFDGILLVTDMDETLLDVHGNVSEENARMLEYFKENGGTLTYASGRNEDNMNLATDVVKPSVPVISDNGSLIIDSSTKDIIWSSLIGDEVLPAVYELEEKFPTTSIEVYTPEKRYICKESPEYKRPEYFVRDFVFGVNYENIPRPWNKLVFAQGRENTRKIRAYAEEHQIFQNFSYFVAGDYFFEILGPNASKGDALRVLRGMLPDICLCVAIGDNENDLSMLKCADISYVPQNAVPAAQNLADFVVSHHNSSALASLIRHLECHLKDRF